jgi:hypothetical protein
MHAHFAPTVKDAHSRVLTCPDDVDSHFHTERISNCHASTFAELLLIHIMRNRTITLSAERHLRNLQLSSIL